MRVLFLDQFSDLGGAQLCLRDVLIEARRRGWAAEVMAPGNGPLLDFARDCGFDARALPIAEYSTGASAAADLLRFGAGMARSARLVRLALQQRPADLIYVNGPRILPAALPAAVQRNTPVVFHAHSVLTTGYARAIAAWSLRRCSATAIACSEFASRPVQSAFGGSAVRVIYNGVADCGFRPRAPQRGQALRVGFVGRIAPEKGPVDFIRAAQLLQGAARLQFSIIGAALFSELRYERAVRELGVSAGIEFRGWTDDVAGVLHNLDILAVPSAAHEASTRVVMEAMSAGTCAVAYPSGGLPELIGNGRTGLLTEKPNPVELARAIQILAGNPGMRGRLAENGRQEWRTRFTVERFQREVCDQIESAASRPTLAASAVRSIAAEERSARDATPA
jgi:glycosyltransferase involved in cell wall biosynthesis